MTEGPPKTAPKILEQQLADLRELQRALAEAREAGDVVAAEALMERHRDAVEGSTLADAERILGKESVLGAKIDYATYAADVDASKAGEEWQLPESIQPNFETAKPFIPDLSSFVGKPRHEVFQYVLDTYGVTHCIPGKEYRDWLAAHPEKTPPSLQDNTKWFYFPGSLVRGLDGDWGVPYAVWYGTGWNRSAYWLTNDWLSYYRVVLLEK